MSLTAEEFSLLPWSMGMMTKQLQEIRHNIDEIDPSALVCIR
jgi:hypothetical protein